MSRWIRKFRQGQADYAIMKPRPKEPTEEQMRHHASARYFGWMIARSRDIQHIIDELNAFEVDQTSDYDRILTRRVDVIDRKHGLIPNNVSKLV